MLKIELSRASGVTVRTLGTLERAAPDDRARSQKRIQHSLAAALGVEVSDIFTKEGKAK